MRAGLIQLEASESLWCGYLRSFFVIVLAIRYCAQSCTFFILKKRVKCGASSDLRVTTGASSEQLSATDSGIILQTQMDHASLEGDQYRETSKSKLFSSAHRAFFSCNFLPVFLPFYRWDSNGRKTCQNVQACLAKTSECRRKCRALKVFHWSYDSCWAHRLCFCLYLSGLENEKL